MFGAILYNRLLTGRYVGHVPFPPRSVSIDPSLPSPPVTQSPAFSPPGSGSGVCGPAAAATHRPPPPLRYADQHTTEQAATKWASRAFSLFLFILNLNVSNLNYFIHLNFDFEKSGWDNEGESRVSGFL